MTRHNGKGNKKNTNAPKKPPLTHFLCIPLVNSVSQPQLEVSIGKFKEHVCSATPIGTLDGTNPTEESSVSKDIDAQAEEKTPPEELTPLVPEKAIRPLGSLHLTLGVMSLNDEKLSQATTLLQSLGLNPLLRETQPQPNTPNPNTKPPNSASSNPLIISLESLEPMQSPSKTSILYIHPKDPTNRLQPLCQALRKIFTEAGLLVPDSRPLILHATIVNTIYIKDRKPQRPKIQDSATQNPSSATSATPKHHPSTTKNPPFRANDPSSGHGPSAKSSLYVDATSLLKTYGSHIWASEIPISRLAICEMGVRKQVSSDGKVVGEAYREVVVREI